MRLDADGANPVSLVDEPSASYFNLRPSPAGTVILFNRTTGSILPGPVFYVSSTGAGLAPFPAPSESPGVWAPDGSRIGWVARGDAGGQIVLTSPTGSAPDTVALADALAWSRDGTRLAIAYKPTNQDLEIGTIDLDGDRARINRTQTPYDDYLPAWSPDGSRIAFYSNRPSAPGLYVMDANGGNQRRLTAATFNMPAQWSPDGTRIGIMSNEGGRHLRVLELDGTEVVLPAVLSGLCWDFAWSPGGANVLVSVVNARGESEVYLGSADFTGLRRIALPASGSAFVGWLPSP